MKTLLLFFIGLYTYSYSQTFEENFLGDDFALYKGVLFKASDKPNMGYKNFFYGDLKYCERPYDPHILYPVKNSTIFTEKDSIVNRVFLVEDIVNYKGEPFTESTLFYTPILVLKDTVTRQIIYFKYDPDFKFYFPFVTSEIIFDESILCARIERKVDDFTDEIKLTSPIMAGKNLSPVSIIKVIDKGVATYYLSLLTYGQTVTVDGTGVIILFSDGTKWNKESKIDVDATENGFRYNAFIPLTTSDLELFTSKTINKFRLYIYDEEIEPIDAKKFTIFLKCIQSLN